MSASLSASARQQLTVVIPTYRRESVLISSLHELLALQHVADEIIVVDQSETHESSTLDQLQKLQSQGLIRWLKRDSPSIPAAMNSGLVSARSGIVLFLDDDICPNGELILAHRLAQAECPSLVAGQVLQPGERPAPLRCSESFRFSSTTPAAVQEFMGGNFSVQRDDAILLGGFDENFVGAAYRFEAEFSFRYISKHGLIHFTPSASIYHLQAPAGGTRAYGHHLRTTKASHSVGAYYFWLRTRQPGWLWSMTMRPLRSIRTKYHLRRPWWIPLTLLAETRGFLFALRLLIKGPTYIKKYPEDWV